MPPTLVVVLTAKVRAVEDQYRAIYAAEGIADELSLPTSYPTSCLLGCVEVVDCLPRVRDIFVLAVCGAVTCFALSKIELRPSRSQQSAVIVSGNVGIRV